MPQTSDRFTDRVDNYVKYRPSYPLELLTYLQNNFDFGSQSICADIGSGTGIFSEILLKNGNRVYSVEPNNEMREAAERNLIQYANFTSVMGTADSTSLQDHSIDFIFCAQSLHWFANAKTAAEFKRILKSNGKLAIIWNKKAYYQSKFMEGIRHIFIHDGIDFLSVKMENIEDEIILHDLLQAPFQKFSMNTKQTFHSYDELLGRLLSISYIPQQGHPKYEGFERNLKALYEKYKNEKGEVEYLYETVMYVFT